MRTYESLDNFGNLESPIKVVDVPTILFERIDSEKVLNELNQKKQKVHKEEITFDDFGKLELTVGEVIKCEKHAKADKLLVSQIDIGDKTIQVVSGIAEFYKPQDMVGKKLVVVTNLKEANIRGEISQGMILAGENKELLEAIEVKNLKAGDEIR